MHTIHIVESGHLRGLAERVPTTKAPPIYQLLSDQYTFRPTGSTTAPPIALNHRITTLLEANKYVHVISLDFLRAFDVVRYSTLFEIPAQLQCCAEICIGPSLFVLNSLDLHPLTTDNQFV